MVKVGTDRKIPTGRDLLFRDRIRQLVGHSFDLFGIAVRQIVFGQDGMHFGVVVTGRPQNIDDFALGVFQISGQSVIFTTTFCPSFAPLRLRSGTKISVGILRLSTLTKA